MGLAASKGVYNYRKDT